jgi:hypothetical protein
MNLNGAVVGTGIIGVSMGIEFLRALDITQSLPSSTVTIGLSVIGLTTIIASRILLLSSATKSKLPEERYALPPIFLFERHDDPTALRVVCELLPKLQEIGYSVYCVEISDIYSPDKIISLIESQVKNFEERHQLVEQIAESKGVLKSELGKINKFDDLLKLLFQFFDNKSDEKTVNTVSRLADSYFRFEHMKKLKETIRKAQECGFSIRGVDDHDAREEFGNKIRPKSCFGRLLEIFRNTLGRINELREQTMARNIVQLSREGKGILFVGGHIHDFSLIEKCKGALSYFTLSPDGEIRMRRYFDARYNNVSKDYLQILTEDEIPSFADRLVDRVRKQNF